MGNGHWTRRKLVSMLMKNIMMKKERRIHRTWHNKLNFCISCKIVAIVCQFSREKKINLYLKFSSRHNDIYMVFCDLRCALFQFKACPHSRALTSCIVRTFFIFFIQVFSPSFALHLRWWILFHAFTLKYRQSACYAFDIWRIAIFVFWNSFDKMVTD